jgi:hypothetical protein
MKILRVFPERTSYTPDDSLAFIGPPPFAALIPPHDEVHVSCVFSWHKEYCRSLRDQWASATGKPVKLGGPAFGSPAAGFTPGLYVKQGIVFTSRGCDNRCPWCIVPKVEGRLAELPVTPGNIIQDNNFLQCSPEHRRKVFDMLKTQRGICFKGGLQADLVTDEIAAEFAGLRIAELWLACDTDAALPRLSDAVGILKRHGFTRDKIKCYALIGEDMDANEARLRQIYAMGAMPFAQLYQPIGEERKREYPGDWNRFARMWQRPAATRAHMEKGTSYKDYNT